MNDLSNEEHQIFGAIVARMEHLSNSFKELRHDVMTRLRHIPMMMLTGLGIFVTIIIAVLSVVFHQIDVVHDDQMDLLERVVVLETINARD